MMIKKIPLFLLALATQSYALTSGTPRAYECSSCEHLSHEPLSMRWDITTPMLKTKIATAAMQTHQYTIHTSHTALQKGIPIRVDTSGAALRISGLADTHSIILKNPRGVTVNILTASAQTDTGDRAFMIEKEGDLFIQLSEHDSAGTYRLHMSGAVTQSDSPLDIQILHSENAYLSITTDRNAYLYGDEIQTTIKTTGKIADNPIINVEAEMIAPDGTSYPLPVTRTDTTAYQAKSVLLDENNSNGENWSIIALATALDKSGNVLNSKIRTTFSYAIPSAVLRSVTQDADNPAIWHVSFENATASRYAWHAVGVYQNANNQNVPVEIVHTANWFEPGIHHIDIQFSDAWLKQYPHLQLGMMEVFDYGQMRKIDEYRSALHPVA